MNIIILAGISGSGKSTWSQSFLQAHPDYVCINRDALRLSLVKTLKGYYQRPDLNRLEGLVNRLSDCILLGAKATGLNVLVDNTNLTEKYINAFINYPGVTWQWKTFDVAIPIAKTRVIMRDIGFSNPNWVWTEEKIEEFLPQVEYIDRQYQQYQNIKKHLLDNHINNQYAEPA